MMRAAIYCRFSTEKQSEASLADQRRICERIAQAEKFRIVATFEDAAISGGTTDRPGYQAMLAAARRYEFDAIVVEDASRLWRELAEQWRALKELADLGVHVVGNGVDTRREEEARMLLAVTGAAAEAFRSEIARRTRRGLEGKARAGKSTGGKAYGYIAARDAASGDIEIDPQQAAIVRRIFERYTEGASPAVIASELNEAGVPSPGADWNRSERRKSGWMGNAIVGGAVRSTGILRNRRYIGEIAFGRTQWKRGAADSRRRKVLLRDEPLHIRTDERLRIIDDDLWQCVQDRLAANQLRIDQREAAGMKRGGRPPGAKSKYLLSGLIRCGQCGAAFTIVNDRAYGCASHIGGRACPGTIHRTNRRELERTVIEDLLPLLRAPEALQILREAAQTVGIPQQVANAATPPIVLDRYKTELAKIGAAIATGEASPAMLARAGELTRLIQRPAKPAGKSIAPPAAMIERFLGEIQAGTDAIHRLLAEGDVPAAREALRQLVRQIDLVEDAEGQYLSVQISPENQPLSRLQGNVVAGAGLRIPTADLRTISVPLMSRSQQRRPEL